MKEEKKEEIKTEEKKQEVKTEEKNEEVKMEEKQKESLLVEQKVEEQHKSEPVSDKAEPLKVCEAEPQPTQNNNALPGIAAVETNVTAEVVEPPKVEELPKAEEHPELQPTLNETAIKGGELATVQEAITQ